MTTEKLTFEVNAELVKDNERMRDEIQQLKEALKNILPLAEQYVYYLEYLPLEPREKRQGLIKIHNAEIETARNLIELNKPEK